MTQNDMKTARPVGDEALRGALKDAFRAGFDISTGWWNAQEGCSPDSSDDFQMLQHEAVNSIWSSLASHPTTGQETVATPRDGGVREALEMARHAVLNKVESYRPWVEKIPGRINPWQATLDAVDAALSAPGSAGPGEPTDALVDRFSDALKAKLRASEQKYGWRNGWLKPDWQVDCQSDLARHVVKGDPLDVAAYAAFCWHHAWPTATPSPAQEPGTGDTGYREPLIRIDPQARAGKEPCGECHLPVGETCDICGARHHTPATTAETRGPAEGAR